MIFFLIVFLIFIVFLAFFIGHNISYVCSFWLFQNYESISVLILVFVAFACGILFSIFVFFVSRFLISSKKNDSKSSSVPVKEEKKKISWKERKIARMEKRNNKKRKEKAKNINVVSENNSQNS